MDEPFRAMATLLPQRSALFAADLYRMYSRYCEAHGWKAETLDASPSDLGGFKEIIFQISGQDVFKRLKYESGVHRVQRVPATEKMGRVHTSTASVAILPLKPFTSYNNNDAEAAAKTTTATLQNHSETITFIAKNNNSNEVAAINHSTEKTFIQPFSKTGANNIITIAADAVGVD